MAQPQLSTDFTRRKKNLHTAVSERILPPWKMCLTQLRVE